jgi:putative flippase GtrA
MRTVSPMQKQLIKFTLIGMLAVIVDLLCYYLLLNLLPERVLSKIRNEAFSKGLSFICGMTVTYFLNKFWTWKKKDHSRKRVIKFALLYGSSLIINVGVNSGLLFVLHEYRSQFDLPYKYFVAFAGAAAVSASINFIGQKFWVFSV